MTILHRANDVMTRTMIVWSLLGLALAFALESIETVLFPHGKAVRIVLESASTFAFWSGYIALLAMIPISAFRPVNRFSFHGDCRMRAQNFLLSVGLSVVVTLGMVIFVAQALFSQQIQAGDKSWLLTGHKQLNFISNSIHLLP